MMRPGLIRMQKGILEGEVMDQTPECLENLNEFALDIIDSATPGKIILSIEGKKYEYTVSDEFKNKFLAMMHYGSRGPALAFLKRNVTSFRKLESVQEMNGVSVDVSNAKVCIDKVQAAMDATHQAWMISSGLNKNIFLMANSELQAIKQKLQNIK